MSKVLSAVVLFLIPLWAFAASREIEAANAPAEVVHVLYVVLFGVIFFGMIVGFFLYLWWLERKKKAGSSQ